MRDQLQALQQSLISRSHIHAKVTAANLHTKREIEGPYPQAHVASYGLYCILFTMDYIHWLFYFAK